MDDIIQKILVTGDAVSAVSMYRDLTNATNQYHDMIKRLENTAASANASTSSHGFPVLNSRVRQQCPPG